MLSNGKHALEGYQFAPLHMVFDIKADGTAKARFVVGEHIVDSSKFAVYASVVKTTSFRSLLTLAHRKQMQVVTGDIDGAYLNANAKNKVHKRVEYTRC